MCGSTRVWVCACVGVCVCDLTLWALQEEWAQRLRRQQQQWERVRAAVADEQVQRMQIREAEMQAQ